MYNNKLLLLLLLNNKLGHLLATFNYVRLGYGSLAYYYYFR